MTDLYKLLEVSCEADEKEIKKSFRKLAKKYHPDLHPGNLEMETKFKAINEAYSILSDPIKRSEYDKKRLGGQKTNQKTNSPKKEHAKRTSNFDINDLNKSFENFFGFDPNSGQPVKKNEKLKKNPLDTSDIFNKFMGF